MYTLYNMILIIHNCTKTIIIYVKEVINATTLSINYLIMNDSHKMIMSHDSMSHT